MNERRNQQKKGETDKQTAQLTNEWRNRRMNGATDKEMAQPKNEIYERIRLGKAQYKTEDSDLVTVEPMEEQTAPVVVRIDYDHMLLRLLLLILLLPT